MKETQNQIPHNMTQLMNMSEFIKKMTQLLVSISLFSYFLISHHSSFLSFLRSDNFYFFTFPYKLLTHTIDKNCMFLLCNGLLVFLAKYSGLIRSLSLTYNHQDEYSFSDMFDSCPFDNSMQETKELIYHKEITVEISAYDHSTENVVIALEEEEEEAENYFMYFNNQVLQGEEDEKIERNGFIISKEEEEEEEEEEDDDDDEEKQIWSNGDIDFGKRVEVEEKLKVEEEEEGNGKLSTEELNKKFDDFIRKIKAEIRIEAKRRLIMV